MQQQPTMTIEAEAEDCFADAAMKSHCGTTAAEADAWRAQIMTTINAILNSPAPIDATPWTGRRRFTAKEIDMIKESQGFKCPVCNNLLTAHSQIDHIKALFLGGKTTLKNGCAMHPNCHQPKTSVEARIRADLKRRLRAAAAAAAAAATAAAAILAKPTQPAVVEQPTSKPTSKKRKRAAAAAVAGSATSGPRWSNGSVPCPYHAGDCRVAADELERISCQYGCLCHVMTAFKATSNHPGAKLQRDIVVQRCQDCDYDPKSDDGNRRNAADAPPQQANSGSGSGSAMVCCPIHANCWIPVDALLVKKCKLGCDNHMANALKPSYEHPQTTEYNDAQHCRWTKCNQLQRQKRLDALVRPSA